MKKLLVFGIIVLLLAGCATLGFKPSEDQVVNLENGLKLSDGIETGLFGLFNLFCTQKIISEPICVVGFAVNEEWRADYSAAIAQIALYRSGGSTQAEMQAAILKANDTYARVAAYLKNMNVTKSATATIQMKALKMGPAPSKDLLLPSGQKK